MIRKEWLRGATVGFALAAGWTLASTNRAAAGNEAAAYLRDHPEACWQVEAFFNARGWELLFEPFRSDSPPGSDGYKQLAKFSKGFVDTYRDVVALTTSERGVRLRRVPCPPQLQYPLTAGGIHPFVGFEIGGGWSTTRFNVDPPFNVNGSGFVSGINGGFLVPLPGSLVSLGPRIGVQGNFFSGTTSNPIASPLFDYTVKNNWMAYQEAVVQFNFRYLPLTESLNVHNAPLVLPFVTLSAGFAEGTTRIQGATPGFSVTDSFTWVGPTFSAGFGVPLYSIIPPSAPVFGGTPFLYTQYRATLAGQNTVNIPGQVRTDFWAQGINFGLEFRY